MKLRTYEERIQQLEQEVKNSEAYNREVNIANITSIDLKYVSLSSRFLSRNVFYVLHA